MRMRILIINPNCDPKMTNVILRAAQSFAGDAFEVVCKSTKCYMTYREDGLMIEIAQLDEIMTVLHEAGGMLMVHAEDNDMIETNIPRLISKSQTERASKISL